MKIPNRRIRVSWTVTAFSVVLLALLVLFSFALFEHRSIKRSEEDRARQNAANLTMMLEDCWDSVISSGTPVVYGSMASNLETADNLEELKAADAYSLYIAARNAAMFNPMLADVTIYYPGSGYVVGSLGVKNVREYWAMTFGSTGEVSFSDWADKLYTHGQNGYLILSGGKDVQLFYRQCMGGLDSRILILRVDPEGVSERLTWMGNDIQDGFFAVTDGENRLLASDRQGDAIRAALNVGPTYEEEAVEGMADENGRLIRPDGKLWKVTESLSSVPGLLYVSAAKKSAMYRLSNISLKISLGLLLLTAIGGTLLALWSVRRTVEPLENIASRLTESVGSEKNEIRMIGEAIEALVQERAVLREQLAAQAEPNQEEEIAVKSEIAAQVMRIVESQYMDQELDLPAVASQANYSQTYISRLFKQEYGMGIAEKINSLRIARGKEMLLESDKSIKSIALEVGFAGDVQFIRAFKRLEGITPGAYREGNIS